MHGYLHFVIFFRNLYIKETYTENISEIYFFFSFFFLSINDVGSKSCSKLAAAAQQRCAYICTNLCVCHYPLRVMTLSTVGRAPSHTGLLFTEITKN